MLTLLHIDASARRVGSHTRRLGRLFVERWKALRPKDLIITRDVGRNPPSSVTESWTAAAFTKPDRRTPAMCLALAESDALVDELEGADLIVAGVPMYNFGIPSAMKAYIDNIVRVGRTFGFDRSRPDDPYWPMFSGKRLVILSARGDYGYAFGERMAHLNYVEPYLRSVFAFIGVTETNSVAVEYDEFADDRLNRSLVEAEGAVERLVREMTSGLERTGYTGGQHSSTSDPKSGLSNRQTSALSSAPECEATPP
jgi:FMN-dependent NADH-azoreductase